MSGTDAAAPSCEGACYCGAVRIAVAGAPRVAAYCHCRSCRTWQGAPINAWTIWREDQVTLTGGPLTRSRVSEQSERLACAECGGAVGNRKPARGMIVIYAAQMVDAGMPFEPAFHLFHAERVMDVADGLPKYRTMPEAFGGDGALDPEPEMTGWRR